MSTKKRPFVDAQGRYHCSCGAIHARGPVGGLNAYRCLNCGRVQNAKQEGSTRVAELASVVIRSWWQVEHYDPNMLGGDRCIIGPEHETQVDAEFFRTQVLSEKLAKKCRVVQYELRRIEPAESKK